MQWVVGRAHSIGSTFWRLWAGQARKLSGPKDRNSTVDVTRCIKKAAQGQVCANCQCRDDDLSSSSFVQARLRWSLSSVHCYPAEGLAELSAIFTHPSLSPCHPHLSLSVTERSLPPLLNHGDIFSRARPSSAFLPSCLLLRISVPS